MGSERNDNKHHDFEDIWTRIAHFAEFNIYLMQAFSNVTWNNSDLEGQ